VVTAVMCMRKFIHSYQVLQLHMSFGLLNNWLPFNSILCSPFLLYLDAFHYIIHPRLTGLEAISFHLYIFLTSLSSGILSTWPNHLTLRTLIKWIIFLCSIKLSSSSLVLIL
jgi:hypothetical protein